MSINKDLRAAMLEYGFDVHPISDGKIHRFKGPEDKKPNGWYVFHGDHGAFGNWRTMGDTHIPWSNRRNLSPSELLSIRGILITPLTPRLFI